MRKNDTVKGKKKILIYGERMKANIPSWWALGRTRKREGRTQDGPLDIFCALLNSVNLYNSWLATMYLKAIGPTVD